jgi:hypothetical protein
VVGDGAGVTLQLSPALALGAGLLTPPSDRPKVSRLFGD